MDFLDVRYNNTLTHAESVKKKYEEGWIMCYLGKKIYLGKSLKNWNGLSHSNSIRKKNIYALRSKLLIVKLRNISNYQWTKIYKWKQQ